MAVPAAAVPVCNEPPCPEVLPQRTPAGPTAVPVLRSAAGAAFEQPSHPAVLTVLENANHVDQTEPDEEHALQVS